MNTLDLSLSHGPFRIGTRLDLNLFANTPVDQWCGGPSEPSWCVQASRRRYRNDFAAERLYLAIARREFDATLGDFYVSLGRGIALNVVKIDELGQDTTIRGGKFSLHHRDLGLTFLAGEFNPLDVDVATGWQEPWKPEPVVAGRLEYRFFDKLLAGAHAVYVIRDDPNATGVDVERTDHDAVWGGSLEAPDLLDGQLALAGEFDLQRTVTAGQVVRGPDAEAEINGLAAYGSATFARGDLTLLGEYKYYDNFRLQAPGNDPPYTLVYHQPPTLERITADIKDNTHVSGGRIRADYNFGTLGPFELLAHVNYGFFVNWKDEEQQIHNPFGGVELSWLDGLGHLEVEAGLRRTQEVEKDELAYQDIHLEVGAEQGFGSHGLKVSYVLLHRTRSAVLGEETWNEMDLSLSYKWSPYLAVGFTFERQEDSSIVREPVNYFSGSVRYYITPATYINVRAGENRPGIKCLSGACRYYPAFSGAEVLAVVRF